MLDVAVRLSISILLLAAVLAASSFAQTQPTAGNGSAQLEDESLYTLQELPDEPPATPELDLDNVGKVGKKGTLSLERMPLESGGEFDTRKRGGAGVRLKFPLGKQP